mgnify:CR=1 FL=1
MADKKKTPDDLKPTAEASISTACLQQLMPALRDQGVDPKVVGSLPGIAAAIPGHTEKDLQSLGAASKKLMAKPGIDAECKKQFQSTLRQNGVLKP